MARRLLAAALLPMLLVGAVLPVAGAWRCPYMGRRAADGCCQDKTAELHAAEPDAPAARIAARCCDPIPAPALDARAGATRAEDALAQAALQAAVAIVLPPANLSPERGEWSRGWAARPRGQPPGERLHQLSSVLRV